MSSRGGDASQAIDPNLETMDPNLVIMSLAASIQLLNSQMQQMQAALGCFLPFPTNEDTGTRQPPSKAPQSLIRLGSRVATPLFSSDKDDSDDERIVHSDNAFSKSEDDSCDDDNDDIRPERTIVKSVTTKPIKYIKSIVQKPKRPLSKVSRETVFELTGMNEYVYKLIRVCQTFRCKSF